jgi:3-oxoacyl-[acyl-carrier-protein] synthase-3
VAVTGVRIAGLGSYLPGPPIDRDGVRRLLRGVPDGTSPEMQERILCESGIHTRHFAIDSPNGPARESNTSLAAEAGSRALRAAGWRPDDVDLLVVTTVVPDQLMPPTSTLVQEALGISRCAELSLSANCTAPYKGLMIAANAIEAGCYERVLLCSSQYVSFLGFPPWVNPERIAENQGHLRWLLSDGAGALALERSEGSPALRVWLDSGGCGRPPGMALQLGARQSDLPGAYAAGRHHVTQDLRHALKHGFVLAAEGLGRMLDDFGVAGREITHFIPSVPSVQAERRFQRLFAERYGVAPETWRTNLTRAGYLGGVQFLTVLDELARNGRLRPEDLVCSVAAESSKWMAAGTIFRWGA